MHAWRSSLKYIHTYMVVLNVDKLLLSIFQPMLLDGYKFDLRVYVLVSSCDPLRIFLYKDGLVSLISIFFPI